MQRARQPGARGSESPAPTRARRDAAGSPPGVGRSTKFASLSPRGGGVGPAGLAELRGGRARISRAGVGALQRPGVREGGRRAGLLRALRACAPEGARVCVRVSMRVSVCACARAWQPGSGGRAAGGGGRATRRPGLPPFLLSTLPQRPGRATSCRVPSQLARQPRQLPLQTERGPRRTRREPGRGGRCCRGGGEAGGGLGVARAEVGAEPPAGFGRGDGRIRRLLRFFKPGSLRALAATPGVRVSGTRTGAGEGKGLQP